MGQDRVLSGITKRMRRPSIGMAARASPQMLRTSSSERRRSVCPDPFIISSARLGSPGGTVQEQNQWIPGPWRAAQPLNHQDLQKNPRPLRPGVSGSAAPKETDQQSNRARKERRIERSVTRALWGATALHRQLIKGLSLKNSKKLSKKLKKGELLALSGLWVFSLSLVSGAMQPNDPTRKG